MRYQILGALVGVAFCSSMALAGNTHQVCVHNQALKSSSCVKQIKVTTPFVEITQDQKSPQWVKVGLHDKAGTVGWVNMKAYRQAEHAYYQPDIQTVFVHIDHAKNGKPTYNVVAYKNGKELTKAEATTLYNKLRDEQQNIFRRNQAFEDRMQRMFERGFMSANRFLDQNNEATYDLPQLGPKGDNATNQTTQ